VAPLCSGAISTQDVLSACDGVSLAVESGGALEDVLAIHGVCFRDTYLVANLHVVTRVGQAVLRALCVQFGYDLLNDLGMFRSPVELFGPEEGRRDASPSASREPH
jgi:hypothetical protein